MGDLRFLVLFLVIPTVCADTDFNCTPVSAEISSSVHSRSVYNSVNIGPYTNELSFISSTIPRSADLTILKEAIKHAFTSNARVRFDGNIIFDAINYVPGSYTFNIGTHSGFNLSVSYNQANIKFPSSGYYTMDSWSTMKPEPVKVTLPTLLNGQFTVQATGLLGYFFVYEGNVIEKRVDLPVIYNCIATSQPSLVVHPMEIDFGNVTLFPGALALDRKLTVSVAQAGVSGQVGIEFINPNVTEGTKIPMGFSWFEILNPADGVAIPVSTNPGGTGLLLTEDSTNFTIRLHPVVGSNGLSQAALIINVVWI